MIALSTAAALATCTASPLAGNWVGVLRDDPGAQGRIVLTSPASAPPRGFWVQPSNAFGGQEIASPLHFKVEGASRAAMPKPLLREFHINISIVCKYGTWVAQLENPERNVTGPAREYSVRVHENGFGLFMPEGDMPVFKIRHLDNEYRIDFGPMTDVPLKRVERVPVTMTTAGYTAPAAEAGIPATTASAQGFDEAKLDRLIRELHAPIDPVRPQLIHSLLVARHGKLVVEDYFKGFSRDVPHDMRSASKTLASLLVGAVAIGHRSFGAATRISDSIAMPGDRRRQAITIGDLLTHRSGLACYDGDNVSPGNEDRMWSEAANGDLYGFIAALPLIASPGTRHAYCSGGINLVGAALAKVTGQSVLDLLEASLAVPLQFGAHYWNTMPGGDAYLGGGALLRPVDMLKLGQLALNGGRWQGQQLVSASWLAQATASQVEISPATTGLAPDAFRRFYFGGADGYAWHLHAVTTPDGRTFQTYEASGNGGQFILVVPKLDMVVVMTGGNYGQGHIWGRWRDEIVGARIIPAIDTP